MNWTNILKEIAEVPLPIGYYKCKSNNYTYYEKGRIYHSEIIGKHLINNPRDWMKVYPYPTSQELIDVIIGDDEKSKSKIVKTLKHWRLTK